MALSKRSVLIAITSGVLVYLVVKLINKQTVTTESTIIDNTLITPPPVTPTTAPPPSDPAPQIGRWIRVQRAIGSDFVNIAGLMAFDENNQRIKAVGAEVVQNYNPTSYPVSNLLDDDRSTFVHTTNTENAYCEIDLGAEYKISKVTIWNRLDAPDRMVGTKMIVFAGDRTGMTIHSINRSSNEYNIKVFKGGSRDL